MCILNKNIEYKKERKEERKQAIGRLSCDVIVFLDPGPKDTPVIYMIKSDNFKAYKMIDVKINYVTS